MESFACRPEVSCGTQEDFRSVLHCGQLDYSLLATGQVIIQDGVPAGWQMDALQCRYTWEPTE